MKHGTAKPLSVNKNAGMYQKPKYEPWGKEQFFRAKIHEEKCLFA